MSEQPWILDPKRAKLAQVQQLLKMLKPRESEVLRLFLTGLSREMVAREMNITADSVRAYLVTLRHKYAACGLKLERKGKVLKMAPRLVMDTRPGRKARA